MLSLRDAIKLFFGNLNPWLLLTAMICALTWRLTLGEFSVWDVAVCLGLIAFEPLQEWLIHVHLLHLRPRTCLGMRIDPEVASKHRAHHREPWDLDTVFIPRRTLIALLPLTFGVWWAILPTWQLTASALTTVYGIGLVYEWTHFLTHTRYKPAGRLYKRIFRYHRLHHFKNEHYWFGVTAHGGDRLLGTMPDPRGVPTSPTARDLGGLAAAGIEG